MQKYAYMIVTPGGNPVTLAHYLPIYWLKKVAQREAAERGFARVVRIEMPWGTLDRARKAGIGGE